MNTEHAKALLLKHRQEMESRVTSIRKDFAEGRPADFAEQVSASENDEVLHSLEDEARTEILQINHALQRLESGLYGICESCGELISQARLQAMPHATLCTRCI